MDWHHLDIYDEGQHRRRLACQRRCAWDLEARLPWEVGVDLQRPLLPLGNCHKLLPQATPAQSLVVSQLLGLIVAATISQLEKAAIRLRGPVWEGVLDRFPVNPEFYALGEQFFLEEAKHAAAFQRYIETFASALAVDPDDLEALLPTVGQRFYEQAYGANARLGGAAFWWLMAAVEEESVVIYRHLDAVRGAVDPLYFQLHRAHFEEELRHKSYALLMLQLFEEASSPLQRALFSRLDFLMAEILHVSWTFGQLTKVGHLRRLRNHHSFFRTLGEALAHIGHLRPWQLLHLLLTSTPYVSQTLHLEEYGHIRVLLERYGSWKLPLPKTAFGEAACIGS